jgi:plasmid replication initiation protein
MCTAPVKDIIYLDNKLAQASYSLNLNEQRLVFLSLSKLNQGYSRRLSKAEEVKYLNGTINLEDLDLRITGEEFDCTTKFTVSIVDYAKTFALELFNARKELQDAADTLQSRVIKLKEVDGSYDKFGWVQRVVYNAKEDSISIWWSIGIVPYIRDLQNYFTKLKLEQLVDLKSTYSWKLLTALQSKKGENKYKSEIIFELADLYFILDVSNSCKEFKHFNNLVLKKVMKELQTKAGLPQLTVRFEKEGRWVKRVIFEGFKMVSATSGKGK